MWRQHVYHNELFFVLCLRESARSLRRFCLFGVPSIFTWITHTQIHLYTSRHTHTHPYPWASLMPYIERALNSSHHSFVLETTGPMVLLSDKWALHYLSCLFPLISSKSIPSPLSLHNSLLLASLSGSVSTWDWSSAGWCPPRQTGYRDF